MAAGVRVLGAKGRPKGVDLGQCQAISLDIELSGDRQERLAAEEILREIDLALGVRGRFARSRVETRNKAPAPSASDAVMIGVLTQKNPFSSKKRWIAFARLCLNTRRGADHIGARPQMRDLAQEFSVRGFGWIGTRPGRRPSRSL